MSSKVSSRGALRAGRLAAAAAALCAAGCAAPGLHSAARTPIAIESPIVQDVMAARRRPGPFPRFADIPKAPADIRPASAWKMDVVDLEARREDLQSQVAALPQPPADTEDFAAHTRAQMPETGPAPTPDSRQQSEDYARALRERATPPPPPN